MSAELTSIEKRVLSKGFSLLDLEKTLAEYQKLNVVMVSNGWVTLLNWFNCYIYGNIYEVHLTINFEI